MRDFSPINAPLGDHLAQELFRCHSKGELFRIESDLVILETVERFTQVLYVVGALKALQWACCRHIPPWWVRFVPWRLCWSFAERLLLCSLVQGHYFIAVDFPIGDERCLVFVWWMHLDLIVSEVSHDLLLHPPAGQSSTEGSCLWDMLGCAWWSRCKISNCHFSSSPRLDWWATPLRVMSLPNEVILEQSVDFLIEDLVPLHIHLSRLLLHRFNLLSYLWGPGTSMLLNKKPIELYLFICRKICPDSKSSFQIWGVYID